MTTQKVYLRRDADAPGSYLLEIVNIGMFDGREYKQVHIVTHLSVSDMEDLFGAYPLLLPGERREVELSIKVVY